MKYIIHIIMALLAVMGWFASKGTKGEFYDCLFVALVFVLTIIEVSITINNNRYPKIVVSLNDEILIDIDKDNYVNHIKIYDDKKDGQKNFPMKINLKNKGNASAKNIQVHFQYPDILIEPYLGNKWNDQGSIEQMWLDKSDGKLVNIKQLSFISNLAINPGNSLMISNGGKINGIIGENNLLVKIRISYEDTKDTIYNVNIETM